ncbi:MAG: cupredoxin domain-containing protein [Limisphaerales bacterium]
MKTLISCAAALGLLLAANSYAQQKAEPNEVRIDNFTFTPKTLTVEKGATVTWINKDDVPHKVTSTDKKKFASKALDTDQKFTHTFTDPGTYDYFCSIHPRMTGKIVVK